MKRVGNHYGIGSGGRERGATFKLSEDKMFEVEIHLPRYGGDSCGYCGTYMRLVSLKVKRAVPDGAIDLNIFDDVTCWQCPQCQSTQLFDKFNPPLVSCSTCKQEIVEYRYALNFPDIPKRTTYGCTSCTLCSGCNRPLEVDHYTMVRYGFTGGTIYIFFHDLCFEQKADPILEVDRRLSDGQCLFCGGSFGFIDRMLNRAKYHSSCIMAGLQL